MTEPASVRSAGLDQPAGDEPCLDVSASEWVGATRELVSQGFTFFDWLTAVDETDRAEDAGFDVVLHLLDVSTPGALRGHLLRTRIPEGSALPSLTQVFAGRPGTSARRTRCSASTSTGSTTGPASGYARCSCRRASRERLRKSFVLAARASAMAGDGARRGRPRRSRRAPARAGAGVRRRSGGRDDGARGRHRTVAVLAAFLVLPLLVGRRSTR